jgi:hypothetical protein
MYPISHVQIKRKKKLQSSVKKITLTVSLKTEDIEAAVKFFNDTIQWAGWNGTTKHTDPLKTYDCPILIKQKIEEKKTTP